MRRWSTMTLVGLCFVMAAVPALADDDPVVCKTIRVVTDDDDDAMKWIQAGGGGWLGVQLHELTDQLGDYFGVKDGDGALVEKVVEDSPAAKAGFEAGDVIVGVGDEDTDGPDDVIAAVRGHKPGDEVAFKVVRKGKEKTLKAELAEREVDVADLGDNEAYQALRSLPRMYRFRGDGGDVDVRALHPMMRGERDKELENLRADIEELRAQVDELREKLDK